MDDDTLTTQEKIVADSMVENYLFPSKKKKKRKRKLDSHHNNNQVKVNHGEANQNGTIGASSGSGISSGASANIASTFDGSSGTSDGNTGDTSERWTVPKKKKKEQNQTPSFTCDLEALFSNAGKRAQGTHLKYADIRSLYMLTVNGRNYPCFPTWCRLNAWMKIQKTVIIMAGCVAEEDYKQNKECFPHLNSAFEQALPVRHEGSDCSIKSPLEALLRYRMPRKLQEFKKLEKLRNESSKSREFYEYILSDEQLIINDFPQWNPAAKEHGVVTTRVSDQRTPPHKDSKLLAMDCEMCYAAGNEQVLTRISIVNSNHDTVYDKLVKPDVPITDYLTQYSGITADMLEGVTTRLCDVQKDILEIVAQDSILAGHSLDFDFRALRLHHDNVIDTSQLYVDQRGPRYKSSLKNLVKTYLNREIQNSASGHCSIEDAKSCMELVLLKIQKGASFGSVDWESESIFEALHRDGKQGAIIDIPAIVRQNLHGNVHGVPCANDAEVVLNCKRFVKNCDLTFAHLKSYENLIKGPTSEDTLPEDRQKCFKAIDASIADIMTMVQPATLVVIALTSGHIHPSIMALAKDKEQRKLKEVHDAFKRARDSLCFVKVTLKMEEG